MNLHLPKRTALFISILSMFGMLSITGCGGGGGGEADVSFSGTFDATNDSLVTREGITICALGGCDVTDNNGDWGFMVDGGNFSGGSVTFDFNGAIIDRQAIVPDLSSDADNISIDFFIQEDGTVVGQSIVETQNAIGEK